MFYMEEVLGHAFNKKLCNFSHFGHFFLKLDHYLFPLKMSNTCKKTKL